ncbi:hypothetical protein ILUMI_15521 [Ignelater luminosus]|uniref:Transposable element P transposase n=1 Tax=Ignelater luminosus TaxID=2038154 RepID=A0A8K0G6S5_IGNLU|nr:hypothetical protein ILUMI_15521 [Ignelater luminosus]
MDDLNRNCVLLFDEMSLSSGFHYKAHKQTITGFEDLDHLGRSSQAANHALVFMARGVRKAWKQVVAYYLTCDTIPSIHLKNIIIKVIDALQKIGLKVVATVCVQGPTNQGALRQLCFNNREKPTSYHFVVNNQSVCTIYDVPHLLKNTRHALLRCEIQFEPGKVAKFEYIEKAFHLDKQKRAYSLLPKLNQSHFNFSDSFLKMKVKVAAAQLSHSMTAAIEIFVSSGDLPAEAIYTAEFVETIDKLLDSLNGFGFDSSKEFYRALSENSPHLAFWSNMLVQLSQWKLITRDAGKDVTKQYAFIEGWQITIRSIIDIWNRLKQEGFKYLSLRSVNQDPLENLFGLVRQRGVRNTNPTCHQFIAALKTSVVNNLSNISTNDNCENDNCSPLSNLTSFLEGCYDNPQNLDVIDYKEFVPESTSNIEDNQATAYVTGYLLHKIVIPDCDACKKTFLSGEVTNKHIFVNFKEHGNATTNLIYASEKAITTLDQIHNRLYEYLEYCGHLQQIENKFKELNKELFNSLINTCSEHNTAESFINNCIRLTIYKYVREKKV